MTTIPSSERLAGRGPLTALIAAYVTALAGHGSAIWFEWPGAIRLALMIATLLLAALATISTGRTITRSQESMAYRERSSISGRDIAAIAAVVLVSLPIASTYLIFPRSWPTTVDSALAMLDAQVDTKSKRKLAYTAYDDLAGLQDSWATSIADRFGMADGNKRLLRDCDREYPRPELCSSVIISRFWKQVRADLPAAERLPLQALELKMERVRLKRHEFKQVPLQDVVAFFNEAIRSQLEAQAQFAIRADPRHANDLVTASWHETAPISLREALRYVSASTALHVRKTPPDLLLEPK